MKQLLQIVLPAAALLVAICNSAAAQVSAADVPLAPRIDSVVMLEPQPHESDADVIWDDNFDDLDLQVAVGDQPVGDPDNPVLMKVKQCLGKRTVPLRW